MNAMNASLQVDALSLRAASRTLVAGLTQTFAPGEVWCIAGPNGAGKTTLIAALAGLSKPAAGRFRSMASTWAPGAQPISHDAAH